MTHSMEPVACETDRPPIVRKKAPLCDCGRPAVGRHGECPWFHCCSKWTPQGGGCKYFRWSKQNPIIHDIALSLAKLGDIRKATQLREEYRTMARLSRELGNEHPRTLQSAALFADILVSVSDLPQAAQAVQDLFEMRRRVLGLNHQVTMSTLGSFTKACGMHESRIRHFLGDNVYEDILQRWGIDPHEHNFYASLEANERKKKAYETVAEVQRKLLEMQRHVLGYEHAETLDTAAALADALESAGDLLQASQVYRELLHVQQHVIGREDLATINTAVSLGDVLKKQGISSSLPWEQERMIWVEAAQLYQETLEVQCRSLGAKHPDALSSAQSLASCLAIAGDLPHAVATYRNLLGMQGQVFGPKDPAVLSTVCNLGRVLQDQACLANVPLEQQKEGFAEAEMLYRKVMDARVIELGWEHEETIHVTWKLAILLEALLERGLQSTSVEDASIEGTLAEVSFLFKRVFELRKSMLGPNHPDTRSALEKATVYTAKLKMPMSRLARRNMPKLCANCGTAFSVRTFDPCSVSRYTVRQHRCPCKQVSYCCAECQRAHWPAHKKECQRKRIDVSNGMLG